MKKQFFFAFIAMLFFSCQKMDVPADPQPRSAALFEKTGQVITYFKTDEDFTDAVAKSVKRTFGEDLPYTLVQVDNIEANNKLAAYIIYKTEKGESSVLITVDMATHQKKIIDCTGSCQCRERLIIKPDGTEVYECTCASCKMEITTMP